MHHPGPAVKAHDQGLLAKRAEHDRHASILRHMRGALIAAPSEIEPDDFRRTGYPEGIHALGRDVQPWQHHLAIKPFLKEVNLMSALLKGIGFVKNEITAPVAG